MLTLYACTTGVFGVPEEVGPWEGVDDGEDPLIGVAQVSIYELVTPAPLALGPDWSCPFPKPPHDLSPDPVMTPLYARRNQISDRYFPFSSCPPNTSVSDTPVLDWPVRASGYVMAAAPLRGLGYGESELGSPAGKILVQVPVPMSRIACEK